MKLIKEIENSPKYGESPVCEIINGKFSWILKVEGHTIPFNGSDNAEYFSRLYHKMGFYIKWFEEEEAV